MTVDVVSRDEWGAREPRGEYTRVARTKGVKVHYTGGAVSLATLLDHDRCLKIMRDIQNFHMDGNKWIDFAYSLGACVHGDVLMGRGPGHLVAANGPGLNEGHYAVIGLIGSKGLIKPTDELLMGILDAIDYLRKHGGAGKEIKGHQDGYSTDCPGGPLYEWVRAGAPRPGGEVPADPNAFPGRLLRYVPGQPLAKGDDVRRWQQAASDLDYILTVDGLYGSESRTVCRHIQRNAGLDDDGIVGRDTWAATVVTPPKA